MLTAAMRSVAILALFAVGIDAGSEQEASLDEFSPKPPPTPTPLQPNATKPSDIAALIALWTANGKQATLIGWGKGDPCVGDSPAGQGNAQGFGPWKGVACVPCSDDPKYYCVSQIWQHQKNLNGTIPETFRGLSELRWLFLSANMLRGPLPENNWFTFPKLRYIDLSYNNITGNIPLDRLSSMPDLEQLYLHDNMFDSLCYYGGGFKKLRKLDMVYNRNMTGEFPAHAFAQLPELRTIMIHDTALYGTVPLPDGPWPALENLVVTGTGGLCGPLPKVCSRKGVFCDVKFPFGPCLPHLVLGTPLASYHNATIRVYAAALKQLGYHGVTIISKYVHPVLYPMFTGFGGVDAGCKEVGCADKCWESGLGATSPCIDFVVDSNIPVNHATWLEPYISQFDVMGTAFETQFITLWAPRYAKLKSISVAAEMDGVNKQIIGFKGGPEDNCNTLYCPKCGDGNLPYITGDPLHSAGFTYKSYPCPEFKDQVQKRIDAKEKFMLLTWTPQVWPAVFPELEPVSIENYSDIAFPNEGKAQVLKTSRWKFTDKAFSVMGAIFIGTHGDQMMDAWSHGFYNEPPEAGEDVYVLPNGQLCDYYSFASACSQEAADKWIRLNQDRTLPDGNIQQGVWKTFFW